MMKIKRLIKRWGLVVVWCGVIFSLSSISIDHDKQFSWLDFIVKKTAHVVEYAILFWLVIKAASNQGANYSRKMFIWTLVFALFYALSDEWHQTFVRGREGTLRDVGFDTIGMLLSWTQINKSI